MKNLENITTTTMTMMSNYHFFIFSNTPFFLIIDEDIYLPIIIFLLLTNLNIHIRGASLGDNLKVSAQTDQYSWEWREIPSYGN